MRLAILQDTLRVGGTERQTLLTASGWQVDGVEVTVVCFQARGKLERLASQLEVPLRTLQNVSTPFPFWAPNLFATLEDLDPDGLLLMGRNANRLGKKLKRHFPKLPVIGTCRTGRALAFGYSDSLRKVDRVVCNSDWAAGRVREIGVAPEKISVIPNARTLDRDGESSKGLRKKTRSEMGTAPETCVLLQVAAFVPGKNHSDLLEVVAGLDSKEQSWELWLVGEGKTLRPAKQMAKQLKIAGQVRFFGFQDDVRPFLAGADLFVSTSREESLPNSLIEAQTLGLPVLAYDVAGVKETFSSGESGVLCPEGDLGSFFEILKDLMADREKRIRMGEAGMEFAKRFPDPLEQGRRYLEVFRGLKGKLRNTQNTRKGRGRTRWIGRFIRGDREGS